MEIDEFIIEKRNDVDEQNLISSDKFVLLSILTFGLYEIWWIYKVWRFFAQKEKLQIMPAFRAMTNILYLYFLLRKIRIFAKANNVETRKSPILMYLGYVLFSIIAILKGPYLFISIFSFMFLLPYFKIFNQTIENSTKFSFIKQKSLNTREIFLVVIGGIIWFFVILNIFVYLALNFNQNSY